MCDFKDRLISWRAGRTREQAASILGVHYNTLANWCSGETTPTPNRRRIIEQLMADHPADSTDGVAA